MVPSWWSVMKILAFSAACALRWRLIVWPSLMITLIGRRPWTYAPAYSGLLSTSLMKPVVGSCQRSSKRPCTALFTGSSLRSSWNQRCVWRMLPSTSKRLNTIAMACCTRRFGSLTMRWSASIT